MSQQTINNGESGAVVRGKLNSNFTELYTGTENRIPKYASGGGFIPSLLIDDGTNVIAGGRLIARAAIDDAFVVENTQAGSNPYISITQAGVNKARIGWKDTEGGLALSADGGATTGLFVKANGNIGIGTLNPATPLDVAGDVTLTKATTNLRLFINNTTPSTGRNWYINSYSDGNLYIGNTTVSDKVTILNSGNVGIGTVTPLAKLDIVASNENSFSSGIRVQRFAVPTQYGLINYSGGSLNLIATNSTGGGAITWFSRSNDGIALTTSMAIDQNGFVGIGTTAPNVRLHIVGGSIRVADNAGSGVAPAAFDANGLLFRTAAFVFDANDNISFAEAKNIFTGFITGTKIGGSNLQKLGFWGVTPVVQPTNLIAGLVKSAVGGTPVNENDTYSGYTMGKIVAALKLVGVLA